MYQHYLSDNTYMYSAFSLSLYIYICLFSETVHKIDVRMFARGCFIQ